MSRCLICDCVIEDTFNSLINESSLMCNKCNNSFKNRNEKFFVSGVEGEVFYYYDEFFKELLFRYKGLGDYVLKDVFLFNKTNYIKRKYKGYSIVLAPSSNYIEDTRGFCHLEGIFKSLNFKMIKCFEKSEDWKQSDKNLSERKEIQKVIKIDKRLLLGVKKVLIVDDVLTSGSTIRAMISQMSPDIDKKVLVLASNCRFLPDEIV